MSRAIITIRNNHDRDRAKRWIDGAPLDMRIEFKAAKRSAAQNDLMWVLLSEVAAQVKHADRKYTADQWKVLFLHAIGREVQFIPALDNSTFIPWGHSSSDLSKEEMTQLIEFILSWGAEHGVTFSDPDSVGTKQQANGDRPNTPAVSGPPSHEAAGVTNSEASALSDDWFETYVIALSGVRDKAASLQTRHAEALQMLGGQPNKRELDLMRRVWRLVQQRNQAIIKPEVYEAGIAKLKAAPERDAA